MTKIQSKRSARRGPAHRRKPSSGRSRPQKLWDKFKSRIPNAAAEIPQGLRDPSYYPELDTFIDCGYTGRRDGPLVFDLVSGKEVGDDNGHLIATIHINPSVPDAIA